MNKIIQNRFANSKIRFGVIMRPENHKTTFSVKYVGFEDHYYALRSENTYKGLNITQQRLQLRTR